MPMRNPKTIINPVSRSAGVNQDVGFVFFRMLIYYTLNGITPCVYPPPGKLLIKKLNVSKYELHDFK
jgi:hypothetical protein